jgi:hypothetical protein
MIAEGNDIPVTLASALLLDLLRVLIDMTGLCKEARQMLFWESCPISETGMVTVIELVRASHCDEDRLSASS